VGESRQGPFEGEGGRGKEQAEMELVANIDCVFCPLAG